MKKTQYSMLVGTSGRYGQNSLHRRVYTDGEHLYIKKDNKLVNVDEQFKNKSHLFINC